MTAVLSQDIIPPGLHLTPQNIILHNLTSRQCDVLSTQLLKDVSVLGVSLRVSARGSVDSLALATTTNVFLVSFKDKAAKGPARKADVLGDVLNNVLRPLAGFGLARIALLLHREYGRHVQGVDLSTLITGNTREPQTAADFASRMIHPAVRMSRIHALWYRNGDKDLCLRAWLSAVLAQASLDLVENARRVDTHNLREVELKCLSGLTMNVELLDAVKPTKMENEFEGVKLHADGGVTVRNARYNTRVRKSGQTAVILQTSGGKTVFGRAVQTKGKQTGVHVTGGSLRGKVTHIRVVGREEQTGSEVARDEFLLLLLQGVISSVTGSQFIRLLWFPTKLGKTSGEIRSTVKIVSDSGASLHTSLNQSQREVVAAMGSVEEPLVVVHGPPGTGKTTTIAAAIEQWDRRGEAVWVVAQSNVGVKNIARTLVKYCVNFKLLVSKEFYVEWHEHLYESIQKQLIRFDKLKDKTCASRILAGSRIMLCTIAMLSNPGLDTCNMFRIVPMQRLIVDEASQIDSFELMHLFHKFSTLQKVCMFGDPKQLPPYGTETAPLMKTIFDFEQLKPRAYFLNTQYRMPVQLGTFISKNVYDSKLLSVHRIKDASCVRFVDVRKGSELSVGSSWQNTEEVHAVVNIVKHYYKCLEFCIITPYDAQRAAISNRLKAENLPSDSVYNVDSFQGHEARFVVVSTVRTTRPGFLKSLNRMNVMLTRCTEGMVLVTNRHFLNNTGRQTLLGKLSRAWSGDAAWVDSLAISDRSANLPGAPGRSKPASDTTALITRLAGISLQTAQAEDDAADALASALPAAQPAPPVPKKNRGRGATQPVETTTRRSTRQVSAAPTPSRSAPPAPARSSAGVLAASDASLSVKHSGVPARRGKWRKGSRADKST